MEVIGYLSTLLIGLSLGLMGAGGSILTVPVMVYFFRLEPASAVRYSLFIVGSTSAVASIPKYQKGEILLKKGIIFASISILMVWLIRSFVIPVIPAILFRSDSITLTFGTLSMIVFSLLMILAAKTMIGPKADCIADKTEKSTSISVLIGCALATGVLTGLLGAGGGFLIVPALTLFFNLDIKKAVGTSLFIISLNTISGFMTDMRIGGIDWIFLMVSAGLAILGAFMGQRISHLFNTKQLRLCFGWFILVLAVIILALQTVALASP
jgi:uncharacterized membrane protein YfcA